MYKRQILLRTGWTAFDEEKTELINQTAVSYTHLMKKCLTLLIATVLSGISLTAYAAQPMSNLDSGQLRPAGTVSATGASNLSDLEDKLAEKAREQGAKGYVINSAGGNDQMRCV